MELFEAAQQAPTLQEQREIYRKVQDIMAEELWAIGISTSTPKLAIVKKDFRNVPRKLIYGYQAPSNGGPETFYFENPKNSPGTIAQIKKEMTRRIAEGALPIAKGAPRVVQAEGAVRPPVSQTSLKFHRVTKSIWNMLARLPIWHWNTCAIKKTTPSC